MINPKSIFFYYDIIFIFILLVIGFITGNLFKVPILLIIVLPLIIYFLGYFIINSKKFVSPKNYFFWIFISLLLTYNFFSTTILFVVSLIFSQSLIEIIISLLYLPLPIYFLLTIYHWYQKVLQNHKIQSTVVKTETVSVGTPLKVDIDRRKFLKLVGGTGISVFLLALVNPKQASAAFFGSVPGPGTVALKDANGLKINPAEKQATDGYKISKIDDTSSDTYSYYGFVNQNGAWYIQRETTSGGDAGNFLYYKGSTNFSSNWTNRATFVYDDFEYVF